MLTGSSAMNAEIKHLNDQIHTLVLENERLRAGLQKIIDNQCGHGAFRIARQALDGVPVYEQQAPREQTPSEYFHTLDIVREPTEQKTKPDDEWTTSPYNPANAGSVEAARERAQKDFDALLQRLEARRG